VAKWLWCASRGVLSFVTAEARAERDAVVLELLARGRRQAVVAEVVGVSTRTVRRIAQRAGREGAGATLSVASWGADREASPA